MQYLTHSFTEQSELHRTTWYNFPHALWEHTYIYKMTSDSKDNQVPHFRTVVLALQTMFSYMTGIYLLNSSSPEHSHQTSVLKNDSFGVGCIEKAGEIRRLSFSEITKRKGELAWMLTWRWLAGATRKADRFMKDSKWKEATDPVLINSNSARQKNQPARESINETWGRYC